MSDNQIDVRISAESGPLNRGMEQAAQYVEQSAQKMRESFSGLKDQVQGHMDRMQDAVKTSTDGMAGHFSALTEVFGRVNTALAAVGAALAGGAAFRAGIDESKQFTGEAIALSRALGISATEASTLNIALGDVYTSSEDFIGASQMLSRQLRINEDALNSMGLSTRDVNGEYRKMKDIMFDAITVINGYKEGLDRNLAMQTLFGRGAASATSLLRLNNEVVDEAKKKQEELGLIVGKENVEALKAYKASMNDAGDVMSAVKKTVGDALMPVLTKLGVWFADIGPAAVVAIKGAIGSLTAAFWLLKNGVTVVWETLNAMVVSVAEPLRALASAMWKLMNGDYKGAWQEFGQSGQTMASAWKGAMREIAESSEETRDKIWNLFAKPASIGGKRATGKDYEDPKEKGEKTEKTKKTKGEKYSEAEWAMEEEAHLRRTYYQIGEERAASEQASFDRATKFAEDWEEDLDRANKSVAADAKKTAEQRVQIEYAWSQNAAAARLAVVDSDQEQARYAVEIGSMTKEELLAQEIQFEQQRNEIRQQALQARLAMIDKDKDHVAYAQTLVALEELERQHQATITDIKHRQKVDDMAPAKSFFGDMGVAFESAIDGMLTKATTLKAAMDNIWRSMAASFVREFIAKKISATIQSFVQEKALAVGNAMTQTSLYQMITGAKVSSLATGTAANVASVGPDVAASGAKAAASLGDAAAKGASAVAPIPFVGPALAIAAFAAIMALMGGGGSKTTTTSRTLPSAAGGYDIPAGINPITQLHEQEMVLPARIAEPLRQSLDGGGIGGGDVHLHVSAVDGASVRRMFMDHGPALADALKAQVRGFRT
jgi:hypothetical protein